MSQRTDAVALLTAAAPWRPAGPSLAKSDPLALPDALLLAAPRQDELDAVQIIEPPAELCYDRRRSPPFVAIGSPPLVPMPPSPVSPVSPGEAAAVSPSPRLRDALDLEPELELDPDIGGLFLPSCPHGSPSTEASDPPSLSPSEAGSDPSVPPRPFTVHLLAESLGFSWMRQHLDGPRPVFFGGGVQPGTRDVSFDLPDEIGLRAELEGLLQLASAGRWLPAATQRPQPPQVFCTPELAERLTDALLDSVHRHFSDHYYSPDAKGRDRARDCGPLAWELGHTSVAARAERARLDEAYGGPLLELLDRRPADANDGAEGRDEALRLQTSSWRHDVDRLLQESTVEALHQGLFASGLVQVVRNGWPVTLGSAPRRRRVAQVTDADASRLRLRLGWTHEGPQQWRLQEHERVPVWVEGTVFVGLNLTLRRAGRTGEDGPMATVSELYLAWQPSRGRRNAAKWA